MTREQFDARMAEHMAAAAARRARYEAMAYEFVHQCMCRGSYAAALRSAERLADR